MSETVFSKKLCIVCGNKGDILKRYGAEACIACTTFFRRNTQKGYYNKCSFAERCDFDGNRRRTCQFCRYQKCLAMGMRYEKVRSAYDNPARRAPVVPQELSESKVVPSIIGAKNSYETSPPSSIQVNVLHSNGLIHSEQCFPALPLSYLKASENTPATDVFINLFTLDLNSYEAVLNDVLTAALGQLLDVYNKDSGVFSFTTVDQVALLRAFAPTFILMEDLYRSKSLQNKSILLHGGMYCVSAQGFAKDINGHSLQSQVYQEMVTKLLPRYQSLDLDHDELRLLMDIAFWNPDVCNVTCREVARETRSSLLLELEQHCSSKKDLQGRTGQLLVFLSSLEKLASIFRRSMSEWQSIPNVIIQQLFAPDDSFLE